MSFGGGTFPLNEQPSLQMTNLPSAYTLRFQPIRSGLLNLFKYQDQEFWYEKGRLLIRGNNGSGKSRVLALQLPFLLDGEISSRRVEPDGDPARQMAWHLLMDDQFEQRTGYTWIEFGRVDDQGVEHFLTLGCGMKAVRGGDNQPSRWFFLTSKRIGRDLDLQEGGTPRSAERLSEALSPEDFFAKTAKEYRMEVNRRLFGLSMGAYSALIELLIRLRAPQLSKKLDEKSLFAALSDALPPLAADVVDQVASAFKQLEDLRHEYQHLKSLSHALTQFRANYQVYLQIALLRRAEAVTSCHSRYEKAQGQVRTLQQTVEAGESRLGEAEAEVNLAHDVRTACTATLEAIQSRPEADLASKLDAAHRDAHEKGTRLNEAQVNLTNTSGRLEICSNERDRQQKLADRAVSDCRILEHEARGKVTPTGFQSDHDEILPGNRDWPKDLVSLVELRDIHKRKGDDHLYRLEQLEREKAKLDQFKVIREQAIFREQEATDKVTAARDLIHTHQQNVESNRREFDRKYDAWQRALRWLKMPPASELSERLEDWYQTDGSEHRVFTSILADSIKADVEVRSAQQAIVEARRSELDGRRDTLENEAAQLTAAPRVPQLPKVRGSAEMERLDRPGAPLWKLCEFETGLSPLQRAGLEAALEAAGILDAWIWPDGRMSSDVFPIDTFILRDDKSLDLGGQNSLADVLILDPEYSGDYVFSDDVLRQVLSGIGLGQDRGSHWVSLDGEWCLGPLRGRGEKQFPEFIGTRSRNSARDRQLQEIDEQRALLAIEFEDLTRESEALRDRGAEAEAEQCSAPKDDLIARHLALRTHAYSVLNELTQALAEVHQQAELACRQYDSEKGNFKTLASHMGYAAHADQIDTLRGSWTHYESAMARLWDKAESVITNLEGLGMAESSLRLVSEDYLAAANRARRAEDESIHARETYAALQATVGISVNEFQTMLASARSNKEAAERGVQDAESQRSQIEKQLTAVRASLPGAEEKVQEAESERDKATGFLRRMFDAGMFAEADERIMEFDTQMWSASKAVSIARSVCKLLPDLPRDDGVWTERLNVLDKRINELRTSTGSACPIESEQLVEGLILVTCIYQGNRLRPSGCLAAIERERETHDRLLAEEERKIIDSHLVTEVSLQLQQLIEQGQDRTRKINLEMEKCATSLGVALKLVWEPKTEEIHPALPSVRRLLLMDHAAWTEAQRSTVGNFLHRLIQDERAKNPAASSAEQLQTALDYRKWHVFAAERQQNGRWERLTRKRYGTGSGGEKALMLTIPQMAAAASHYSSAAIHSPRFILLDEAFAGMDKPTRGRCMGLLEAFDLDLLMTSEREHGAHASLSGIAIYQLTADSEAVAATRWVWNGINKVAATVPDTPELRTLDRRSA